MHHACLRAAGDADANFLQPVLEPSRESMHTGELREVVRESVRGRRRQDACLPHAAAEELSEPPCALDEVLRTNEARANGRTYTQRLRMAAPTDELCISSWVTHPGPC